jgi:hypothetical protein
MRAHIGFSRSSSLRWWMHTITQDCSERIYHAESPRTTKLYDGREDDISLDEVERIAI